MDDYTRHGWGSGLVLLAVGLAGWAAALFLLYALLTWVPTRIVVALVGSGGFAFVVVSLAEDVMLHLKLRKMEKKDEL